MTKPDKKTIKPIHMFEAEMMPQSDVEITTVIIPRYIVIYAHLNEHKVNEIIKFLQGEKDKGIKGTLTLPLMGIMV